MMEQGQTDPNTPLSDDFLRAHATDPDIVPYLTSAERRRLSGLKPVTGQHKMSDPPEPAEPTEMPRDARGLPAVSGNLSEEGGPPSGLLDMLGPLAHPETLTDFARLLTLPVDTVRRAMASVLTMQGAKSAAGAAVRGATKGAAAAGDIVHPDVIGAVSPRAGKIVEIAQRVRSAGEKAQAAAPAAVAESAPVAEAAAQTVTSTTNALPNQKLLNELAIQARRAKFRLTPETEAAAIKAVEGGATPAEAVAGVAPGTSPVASVAAPAKLHLSAPETKEFGRLVRGGMTDEEARSVIEASRELAGKLGLKTPTYAETTFPKGMRGKPPLR